MNFKKYLPHLLAVIVFLTITIIYFSPLFKGKVINQSDITQYKGISKEARDYRESGQGEALWTNALFGGMPAYQVSTSYPGNWLNAIDRAVHLFLPHPSGYIFMGFMGFFILLLCLQINPWLALAGSLAYGFSSFFFIILEVGHNSQSNALGYLAPILGGMVLLMRRKYWLGFALTAFFMALELNANHVQITYYGFLLFALVFTRYFVLAFKEKRTGAFMKGLSFFVVASALAVLPNAASLMATYEYGHYTTRGPTELTIDANLKTNKGNITTGLDKNYATQYSYGIDETFTFLIPNFKGGISAPISYANKEALKGIDPEVKGQIGQETAYFGDQTITSGPVYIGAIVMLLAFLGLLIADHPLKWPLFVATAFSVMLSWGKYFMGLTSLFMDYVPGYNKFRAVSMILVIAEMTIPLLAVLALDKFMKISTTQALVKIPFVHKNFSLKKILIVSGIVVGGFCLLNFFAPTAMNSFIGANEEMEIANKYKQGGVSEAQINEAMPLYLRNLAKARENIFKADAMRSFIFVVLAFACLFLYFIKKINGQLCLAALCVLIMADLWPVANRYLNNQSFVSKMQYDNPPMKTMADEQILADSALDFRVLNLTVNPFQDGVTSYYHKSIGGYHGAKLKKYDELISFHLFGESGRFYSGLSETRGNDSLIRELTMGLNVLNMLNTKYFILPLSTSEEPVAFENQSANGNAWFVKTLKTVASADSEIVGLYHTDTKSQALIQQKNKPAGGLAEKYDASGSIKLHSYKPNDLVYETDAPGKQFAVFSEIYYPKGWNAYVDGKPEPHYCVDYLLRGMEVPAGRHRIEFKFEPKIYKTGNAISTAGSVLILLAVALSLYMAFRKKEMGPVAT